MCIRAGRFGGGLVLPCAHCKTEDRVNKVLVSTSECHISSTINSMLPGANQCQSCKTIPERATALLPNFQRGKLRSGEGKQKGRDRLEKAQPIHT